MSRLLPVFAVLWLLLSGAASGMSLHTPEVPPGNFLLNLSEVSGPDALKNPAGIRENELFDYEGALEDALCHNDPINRVDVLGAAERLVRRQIRNGDLMILYESWEQNPWQWVFGGRSNVIQKWEKASASDLNNGIGFHRAPTADGSWEWKVGSAPRVGEFMQGLGKEMEGGPELANALMIGCWGSIAAAPVMASAGPAVTGWCLTNPIVTTNVVTGGVGVGAGLMGADGCPTTPAVNATRRGLVTATNKAWQSAKPALGEFTEMGLHRRGMLSYAVEPGRKVVSKSRAVFRGTTSGYPGGGSGVTFTSTDPAVAAVFAVQKKGLGTPVIEIARKVDLAHVSRLPSTSPSLAKIEAEIIFDFSPTEFSRLATQVPLDDAVRVLNGMGVRVPGNVPLSDVSSVLRELQKLNQSQIDTFLRAVAQ